MIPTPHGKSQDSTRGVEISSTRRSIARRLFILWLEKSSDASGVTVEKQMQEGSKPRLVAQPIAPDVSIADRPSEPITPEHGSAGYFLNKQKRFHDRSVDGWQHALGVEV